MEAEAEEDSYEDPIHKLAAVGVVVVVCASGVGGSSARSIAAAVGVVGCVHVGQTVREGAEGGNGREETGY